MITKEQFKEAENIIIDYNKQLNKEFVTKRICCICKENSVDPLSNHVGPLEQEEGKWNYGAVGKISFKFGSRHDYNSYYIAICDDCLDDLKSFGLAVDLNDIKNQIREKKQ